MEDGEVIGADFGMTVDYRVGQIGRYGAESYTVVALRHGEPTGTVVVERAR